MKVAQAEEKVRKNITEIRKEFTNKKWCAWADAWLSGEDRSLESAMEIAKALAHRVPKTVVANRPPTRAALLSAPAANAALAAANIARSTSDELDQFASMMLEGYVKPPAKSPAPKVKGKATELSKKKSKKSETIPGSKQNRRNS